MPDLDVRITSMYPPGVQGGIRAYASATIAGCFAVRGIKIVEGGETSGIGSVWRGTVHGTGIYLTDSTPSKSRAEHGLI